MLIANVHKKYTIKMTIIDQMSGPEDKIIGQLWAYTVPSCDKPRPKDPNWFQFVPKRLPEFEGFRVFDDGRDSQGEILDGIKTTYSRLKREGYVDARAKLLFSMTPVEQVF